LVGHNLHHLFKGKLWSNRAETTFQTTLRNIDYPMLLNALFDMDGTIIGPGRNKRGLVSIASANSLYPLKHSDWSILAGMRIMSDCRLVDSICGASRFFMLKPITDTVMTVQIKSTSATLLSLTCVLTCLLWHYYPKGCSICACLLRFRRTEGASPFGIEFRQRRAQQNVTFIDSFISIKIVALILWQGLI
jgi:hypothetical protein